MTSLSVNDILLAHIVDRAKQHVDCSPESPQAHELGWRH